MRLVVVRHGATANNLEARYTGQSDVPLSPLGEAQASAVAQALARERFDVLVSSDLIRAQQTAAPLARRLGMEVVLDPGLREIAMGEWEGLGFAEVEARDPDLVKLWRRDPMTHAPAGGETVTQLDARVARALSRWKTAHPTGSVLWTTHGGVLGALLCLLLGVDVRRRWQFRRDNTGIFEFDIGPDYAILMRANDTGHLRGIAGPSEDRQIL